MENVNVNSSIKALGEYVLIKQTMVKKKGAIIMDASKNDKDKFDISFKIVQLGDKCTQDINIGDIPIFEEYVKFNLGRILHKTDNKMEALFIVHQNSIIGIDTDPNFKMITTD